MKLAVFYVALLVGLAVLIVMAYGPAWGCDGTVVRGVFSLECIEEDDRG